MDRLNLVCNLLIALLLLQPALASAQTTTPSIQHPALFLVGDSLMKTGSDNGVTGPWGWGYEFAPMCDPAKIHIYNQGLGGRSSRGYLEEGAWDKILPEVQPGDFLIVDFGHNDAADSSAYPDRMTAKGNDDQMHDVISKVTQKTKSVHTYGWYMRKYATDAKSKGATVIISSCLPRDQWINGKIKRGFDGYAAWSQQAAEQAGVFFMPVNEIAANHYDALGQQEAQKYFNDNQHTKKPGAQLNARSIAEGLNQLKNCPLADDLLPGPPATTKP